MTRKILLGLLVLGTLLALLNLDRLAYYRALLTWRAHNIREYEMDEVVHSSPLGVVLVPSRLHVRDGKVVSVANPSLSQEQMPEAYADSRTVDGLFASIERFMNHGEHDADMVQVVTYDLVFGYPTSIWVKPQPPPGVMIFDGDQLTTVQHFTIFKTPAAP
jgi:hypothetical protein